MVTTRAASISACSAFERIALGRGLQQRLLHVPDLGDAIGDRRDQALHRGIGLANRLRSRPAAASAPARSCVAAW
jgi:hypothetical protein